MTIGYLILITGIVGLTGTVIWILVDALRKNNVENPHEPLKFAVQDNKAVYDAGTVQVGGDYRQGGRNIIPPSESFNGRNNITSFSGAEKKTDVMQTEEMKTGTSKFCTKCGTANKSGSNFCPKCGSRL